jgi:molybdate transport system substrate-binding protein
MFLGLSLVLTLTQGVAGAVTVSAAVSLTEALEDVAAAYRSAGGGPVTFNFAGSNVLSRQIVSGAPVDVFISADEAQMEVVQRAGLVAPGTRVPLIGNTLVVVVHGTRSAFVKSIAELAGEDVRRVAIGDPAAVPAGVYARAYLERIGLWMRLEHKMVPSANVRAALTAVQNGSADAAIVYATDARIARDLRIAATISGPGSPRIVYPVCVVKSARQPESAARFLQFLRGPVAQAIFERHGFTPMSSRP